MRWRIWGAHAALVAGIATTGCVGTVGSSDDVGDDDGLQPGEFAPAAATIHVLTPVQLRNSYRFLFGDDLVAPTDLPKVDPKYGFTSIDAAARTLSPLDVEKLETATYAVLSQVWDDPARRSALVGCEIASISDACVRSYVSSFGRKVFRRPLEKSEVDAFLGTGEKIAADLGPVEGVRYLTAAMLQSPHFLFRVETGVLVDPLSGHLQYSSLEMAGRLSFLLWDAPPDAALLDEAEKGALDTASGVQKAAERLLADPRARPALTRFFGEFMDINGLDQLSKNPDAFPMFSTTLGASMRGEMEEMFASVVFDAEGDFTELFTTRNTFINDELATIYGIPGEFGAELVPFTLPDDGRRGGILTTPGFLAQQANEAVTSPTHRGRFVRISLLCEDVKPAPMNVVTDLPAYDPTNPMTLRDRLEEIHLADPYCASCHSAMDPIGFAFEHYDAIGAFRDDENGLPIDSATDLNGEPVPDGVVMSEKLGALPQVSACVARRFYQHAVAHLEQPGEAKAVESLVDDFVASDFNFRALVVALVVNDGFRFAATPVSDAKGGS